MSALLYSFPSFQTSSRSPSECDLWSLMTDWVASSDWVLVPESLATIIAMARPPPLAPRQPAPWSLLWTISSGLMGHVLDWDVLCLLNCTHSFGILRVQLKISNINDLIQNDVLFKIFICTRVLDFLRNAVPVHAAGGGTGLIKVLF